MDKNVQRNWMIILYLIVLGLFIRFFPKIGYALAAITLLVLLIHFRKSLKTTKHPLITYSPIMNMLLCQLTTITFVFYAIVNTFAYTRLRKEVKIHKKHCGNKKDE